MKILRFLRNYFFYCGIEKDDYNALKKDAYISNFKIWRLLHFIMAAAFGILFSFSMFSGMMEVNMYFYLAAFGYSCLAMIAFHLLKPDALIAQFMIYLSISLLFIFGILITMNKPEYPGVTFIVFLLISPMLMIDKPYFMAIELSAAAAVYLIWMYQVKPYDIWKIDFVNVVAYTIIGIFLNILSNSIRIKEFVLTREINKQKDTDELTGLKNKSALTREINKFMEDDSNKHGLMFLFDIDKFKSINDTLGHDVGDQVIEQLGTYLGKKFTGDEVVGRFGGDEFVIFIKNNDDIDSACHIAQDIVDGVAENVALPNGQKVSISIGIAVYDGIEKGYSKVFKQADTALYRAKADTVKRYAVYEDTDAEK